MIFEDEDDYEVIKSNQEDNGDYYMIDDSESSNFLISSKFSQCVDLADFNQEDNLNDSLEIQNLNVINPEESYTYGIINKKVKIIQDIIFKIYTDFYSSINHCEHHFKTLFELVSSINKITIKRDKIPVDKLCSFQYCDELFNYFDRIFYKHIKSSIIENNRDKTFRILKETENLFYIKIFIFNSSTTISTRQYWNLSYYFIEELSKLFGVFYDDIKMKYYINEK